MEVIGNKCVIYEFGKFVLDPKERTLFADGTPVHLPAKEFDTLLLLVEHNGRALTKEEMMSAIWCDSFVEESNLAKQISRLRKLLNTNGEQFIETLPKHGYRFRAELRRTLIEPEDAVILEKRTVKRVTFAVENEIEPERLALPPARRVALTLPRLTLLAVVIIGLVSFAWYFRRNIFPVTSAAIDPYAPIRLTDNPNDDTGPQWTRDGRIRFYRVYPDRHSEMWTMSADGSDQTLIKDPEGKKIISWSPDGQKAIFQKSNDQTTYLSNSDGSNEMVIPMRGGEWSADSKMLVYMQRMTGDDLDIFTYSLYTGKIQNVTDDPALDADPSFSPDGKQIVFDSDRDGNQEIYLMNVDGSGIRRLTFNTAGDAHPAFSPDGTQIIFTSSRDSEDADVYSMNTDGSNQIKLVGWDKSNETAGPGAWSPDGTKLAFFSDRNGGHDDIYLVSAERVRPDLILSDSEHDLKAPSYSPDGHKIIYSRELDDKSGELRVYDQRSDRSTLIKHTELPTVPRWSPDGQRIAFYDRTQGDSEIFSIKPDGSDLHRLTTDPSIDAEPAWSPDGGKIVFETGRGAPLGKPQLYVMNSDGTDQHPLTPRKGWEGNASWAPDGNSVVFACDREDSPGNMLDICEINNDGTGEKHLLYHRDHDTNPSVSPDGKRVVFVANSDGNAEIYITNRDGTGLLRLTRNPADDEWPQWSPDGSRIIFSSNRNGKFAIYEIDLEELKTP